MAFDQVSIVVVGSLATDIVGIGFDQLAGPGELSYGGRLHIGAGGKARNIAHMIAVLAGKNKVAMVGRTVHDPYNLYEVPLKALETVGVNCEYVRILSSAETDAFPTIALIPVNKTGTNQIYVLPGINEEFPTELISEALPLFKRAVQNNGMLVLSAEMPFTAAIYAIEKANECSLCVALDPGGIAHWSDLSSLLDKNIFLLKPNEQETEILTGVKVTGLDSAKAAAKQLLNRHVQNVLITQGAEGAYLINKEVTVHISTPPILDSTSKDETGCGDQTMAAICASLQQGYGLEDAAKDAIFAGTLQFCKIGISPVTQDELANARQQYLHAIES